MARLFPSLMAADLLNLAEVIITLDPYCDGFHIDIMDGHFVPNITFGADMTNAIAKQAQKPSWVHLMIDNPCEFIKKLHLKRDSIISFHPESCSDSERVIELIHGQQCKASIALKPSTSLNIIIHLLPLLDQVLIMSVEPGLSGQAYIQASELKIKELVAHKKAHGLSFTIGIDGGIDAQQISKLKALGVDDFAVASAIFKHADYKAACVALENLVKKP